MALEKIIVLEDTFGQWLAKTNLIIDWVNSLGDAEGEGI